MKRATSRSAGNAPRKRNGIIREDIFHRAMELFERKSFRATSMQDIADVCGVTKPAIYYYFKSKYDLLRTLYDVVTSDFYEDVESLVRSALAPDEKLKRLIDAQVIYSIEQRRFQRLFHRERHEFSHAARSALARRERAYEKLVQNVIEEGQRSGLFRAMNAHLATLSILGLLSSVHRWASHSGLPSEQVASGIVDVVMGGLSAAGNRSPRRTNRRSNVKQRNRA
jgi:AcrR family transcriptional regulator